MPFLKSPSCYKKHSLLFGKSHGKVEQQKCLAGSRCTFHRDDRAACISSGPGKDFLDPALEFSLLISQKITAAQKPVRFSRRGDQVIGSPEVLVQILFHIP